MKCITGARYTMLATVMVQSIAGQSGTVTTFERNGLETEREFYQDPDSGAIEREWVEAPESGLIIDTETPEYNTLSFKCSARGFADGGLRVVGTAERFSSRGYIETVDYVTLKFPPNIDLSNRDRITKIRDARSQEILWKEEDGRPTVFEVSGVTPIFDPFGKKIENSALLSRAEVQGDIVGP